MVEALLGVVVIMSTRRINNEFGDFLSFLYTKQKKKKEGIDEKKKAVFLSLYRINHNLRRKTLHG